MENLLQNLTETLSGMVSIYKDILQTAQKKQKHIISGDIDLLESIIYQERNLAESILLLEEKRRYIMKSINHAIGPCDTVLTLKVLSGQIKEPYKSELTKLCDDIKDIIIKVEAVNRVNFSLTKYSLNFINKFLRSMCSESLNDTTYKQTGKLNDPGIKRMLLEVSA